MVLFLHYIFFIHVWILVLYFSSILSCLAILLFAFDILSAFLYYCKCKTFIWLYNFSWSFSNNIQAHNYNNLAVCLTMYHISVFGGTCVIMIWSGRFEPHKRGGGMSRSVTAKQNIAPQQSCDLCARGHHVWPAATRELHALKGNSGETWRSTAR